MVNDRILPWVFAEIFALPLIQNVTKKNGGGNALETRKLDINSVAAMVTILSKVSRELRLDVRWDANLSLHRRIAFKNQCSVVHEIILEAAGFLSRPAAFFL